jgi:hypothetical protein
MKTKEMYAKLEDINPEKAKELLKLNTENRPKNEQNINHYAKQMEFGQWTLSGQTISISDQNVLIDGQNRLYAVIKSNTTIRFMVAYNVPHQSSINYDSLRARTMGDVFAIQKVFNYNLVASIIKSYSALHSNRFKYVFINSTTNNISGHTKFIMSKTDMAIFYKENKEIIDLIAVKSLNNYSKIRLFTPSQIGSIMLYLCKDKNHPINKVIDFMHQLHFNDYVENSSISLLREKIITSTMSNYKMTTNLKYIFLIKCWNAFILGKEIKVYQYSSNETMPSFL